MPKAVPMTKKSDEPADAAWRRYYEGLSDEGKIKLWKDYYARRRSTASQSPATIGRHIGRSRIRARLAGGMVVSQVAPEPSHGFFAAGNQLRSLFIGLASGGAILLVFAFVLFNEMVITPFIRPSQSASVVPAVNAAGVPVDTAPKIRIPDINVDIPLVMGLQTTDAKQFELALDQGVVHYPTTVLPGQAGNTAFFGHSSNNIFNPGKYKFAFVLLHELENGDTFYLTHEGTLYTYEVISKRVVKPTEVGVLGAVPGQAATATLITCDPPGTSTNRLVVVGKQTSPLAAGGSAPSEEVAALPEPPSLDSLPGNGPGLLNRIYRSVFNGQ